MGATRAGRSGRFLFTKRVAHCRCEIRLKISLAILLIALIYATASNYFDLPGSSKDLNPIQSNSELLHSIYNKAPSSLASSHVRQLLQFEMEVDLNPEFQCIPASINNYPRDPFTPEQRRYGFLLIHLFIALYMFLAVAIICDEYFVPSLEHICEKLNLQEDVAGRI